MRPRYPCALCGREQTAESMIYSRHTGRRFCRSCQQRVGKPRRRRRVSA